MARQAERSVVGAPFVVLALAAVGTYFLSNALDIHDSFMNLYQHLPKMVWYHFELYAAVFLRIDALAVESEPPRTWASVPAMWGTTAFSAVGALLTSLFLGSVLGAVAIAVALKANLAWPFLFGVPVILAGLAVSSGVRNVRARRQARIVPRPF